MMSHADAMACADEHTWLRAGCWLWQGRPGRRTARRQAAACSCRGPRRQASNAGVAAATSRRALLLTRLVVWLLGGLWMQGLLWWLRWWGRVAGLLVTWLRGLLRWLLRLMGLKRQLTIWWTYDGCTAHRVTRW